MGAIRENLPANSVCKSRKELSNCLYFRSAVTDWSGLFQGWKVDENVNYLGRARLYDV